jgi:hypothetical protein
MLKIFSKRSFTIMPNQGRKENAMKVRDLFIGAVIFFLGLAIAAPVTAQTWIQLNPIPDPIYGSPLSRAYHSAVYNPTTNRMIVFAGARDSSGYDIVNEVWVLTNADGSELSTPAWIKINSGGGPGPREWTAAVFDQTNNRMIVHGGNTMPGYCEGVVNDTWVLTNADGTGGTPAWILLSNQGPTLRMHQAAYDAANNRLIVQSGMPWGCGPFFMDAWVLTNANGLGGDPVWTKLEPASTPPGNYYTLGAGYDTASNTLTAFTMDWLEFLNKVWVLNNANGLGVAPAWTELTPSGVSPPVRAYASTVYDGNRNRMVIFGGLGSGVTMNDAWRLENANGQGGATQWTLLNPTGTPPVPRLFGSAVYNPGTDRMIIFGGADWYDQSIFGDVWVLTEAMGAPPNFPPVALCQNVTLAAGPNCTSNASIDNGSYDPDGDSITLTQSPAGPYQKGTTPVTLTVTDSKGASSQCTGTVTVVDTTAPTITAASVNPSALWPPNHKMVAVTVNYNATDNCGQPACQISSVVSNEPIISADYSIVNAHQVQLRAERLGSGNGRIYTIAITCTDASGNSSNQAVTVTVPHDQGNK